MVSQVKGDSGYALEEVIFGGRIRHRHCKQAEFFQVQCTGRNCPCLPLFFSFLAVASVTSVLLIAGRVCYFDRG